jgi:hypothetical protein
MRLRLEAARCLCEILSPVLLSFYAENGLAFSTYVFREDTFWKLELTQSTLGHKGRFGENIQHCG